MGNEDEGLVHDEVEVEDFEYDIDTDSFKYPCPCGDEFIVSREDLMNGGKYAKCPSCSLMVEVIFNVEDLKKIVEVKSGKKTTSNKSSSLRATN